MGGISKEPTNDRTRSSIAIPAKLTDALGEVNKDAPVYALIGAYALIVYALSLYLHDVHKYQPLLYLHTWTLFSLLFLASIWAVQAVRNDSLRPFSAFLVILGQHWNGYLVRGIPLILATAIFYGVFTSAKNMLPDIHAFTWDPVLASIDHRMLGGKDGWKIAAEAFPDGLPLQIIDLIYTKVWLFLLLGVSAYACVSRDFCHLRRRFLLTFFLAWIIAGNILACIFMSGGPCFYAGFTHDHLRFAGLLRSIGGTGSTMEQSYLWQAYVSRQGGLAVGISAFPSVHLVSTAIVALLLTKINARLLWPGIVLTALMEIGSVRLGWHYVSDGLAGIAIAILVWHLVEVAERHALKWPNALGF